MADEAQVCCRRIRRIGFGGEDARISGHKPAASENPSQRMHMPVAKGKIQVRARRICTSSKGD